MMTDYPTCFIAMSCCCIVVACAQRVTWSFVLVVVSAFACVFASPFPSLPSSSIIKYVIDFEWPNGEEGTEMEDAIFLSLTAVTAVAVTAKARLHQ